MLDLAFVRENSELVEQKLAERGQPASLDTFRELDQQRRRLLTEVESLKSLRHRAGDEIARLKQQQQDAGERIREMKSVSERIKSLDEEVRQLEVQLYQVLENLPNIPHASVPVGSGAEQNLEVRRWGQIPQFAFTAKPHWELGEALGILDLARAAKITGARFAVYWELGAQLERALANFMMDVHTREHGYREVLPPSIINSASLFSTGQLPKFAGDLFHLENTDLWLSPTAEVPVTNLFRDEVLDADDLPISLVAYTPCYRSEAGTYGKDTRGIVRQHQFQKVELVKFVHPSRSYDELEALTGHAEAILQQLELPYRVVALCTGDLGFSAAKTYDLEVWLAGQGVYREISSCSNFENFQARRANIRFRTGGKGKSAHVHTLNGSGLAIGRTWMAVVENYQQEDGSVIIPEVLRKYLNGAERIAPTGRLARK